MKMQREIMEMQNMRNNICLEVSRQVQNNETTIRQGLENYGMLSPKNIEFVKELLNERV